MLIVAEFLVSVRARRNGVTLASIFDDRGANRFDSSLNS